MLVRVAVIRPSPTTRVAIGTARTASASMIVIQRFTAADLLLCRYFDFPDRFINSQTRMCFRTPTHRSSVHLNGRLSTPSPRSVAAPADTVLLALLPSVAVGSPKPMARPAFKSHSAPFSESLTEFLLRFDVCIPVLQVEPMCPVPDDVRTHGDRSATLSSGPCFDSIQQCFPDPT